jgi:hypothetical protein
MYMYLYLLYIYINYFYFSDNISFLSLDTHPLLLRSCITASLYQRYGKMPFPTIKIILLKTLHVCTTYVFKIWTKWRFVIHWDVIMMLLQLQFYCMNMHRVVTTNGSLINWSDDLSPLYYHQNGRPVHFGSISLQVSLLNVYTSNEHRRVPNSKGQWDVSRKPTSIKIWRTLISGVIGRPVSLVESFHHFGRPLL